ncbi:MAG TPA: hypothetical protein VFE51_09655 [Verrucomicrobiae bacterium]|nr:hypothetical protein [Verrucomicrobiae bacterium]
MIDAVTGILMKFGLEKAASQIQKWGSLKIRATMVLHGGNHRQGLELQVTAVNLGERPVRIKKVMVLLEKTPITENNMPPNLPPEVVTELLARLREAESKLVECSVSLFDGEKDNDSFELCPHGHDYTWSMAFANDVKFLSEKKRGREYGRGYVLLTSGKKINFKFSILHADQWERTVEAFSS